MVSPEHEPKLSARDVIAFTDAELDEYLDKLRAGGGTAIIDIKDPKNLTQDFIQRLRVRAQRASSAALLSTPVDLDQVAARLRDASPRRDTSPPPWSPARSFGSTPDTEVVPREEEIREYYDTLVNDGGRPVFPLDRIDEVAKDVSTHWETLRPWIGFGDSFYPRSGPVDDVGFSAFGEQVENWQRFRRWQEENRLFDEAPPTPQMQESISNYTEQVENWQRFRRWQEENRLFDEAPPTLQTQESISNYTERSGERPVLKSFWDYRHASPTHTGAMKKFLAGYGFTRSFRLGVDHKQQGPLTTWIEYLGFQYSFHYRSRRVVTVNQPGFDQAWEKLSGTGLLRSYETKEYLGSSKWLWGMQKEIWKAEADIASAESDAAAILKGSREDIASRGPQRSTPEGRARSIADAQSRLDTAKASLRVIRRRNVFVNEFRNATDEYREAARATTCFETRAKWVLEQLPLVEAEFKESTAARTGSGAVRGPKRPRRGDDAEGSEDGGALDGRSIKRRSRDADEPGSQGEGLGRSHDGTPGDEAAQQYNARSRGLRSEKGAPRGADAELAGGSREAGGADGDGQSVAGTAGRRGRRAARADHRLPPKKNAGRRASSSEPPKLRRSARIAARQAAQRAALPPAGASKAPPKGPAAKRPGLKR